MPSPQAIRKSLLQALDEKILPDMAGEASGPLLLAGAPTILPGSVSVTHLNVPPLADGEDISSKFGRHWHEVGLNDFPAPYMAFVFEGGADLRVGTTVSMARAAPQGSEWSRSGCHVLHLPAPSFVLFPAGVPYAGTGTYWEREEPQPASIKILWIRLLSTAVQCHISVTEMGERESKHPLLIEDDALPMLAALVEKELQERDSRFASVTKHVLTALFLRLRRRLEMDAPVIANTAWLAKPQFFNSDGEATLSERARQIVERTDEYIQIHLAEPLSLSQIAVHSGVSATYLNQIFNAALGHSVRRYLNRRRVAAACAMLEKTEMSIKEISALTGFSQVSHFCQVFVRIQGVSPGKFRVSARQ